MTNPLPRLAVAADPILKGRHPLHDSRYIISADAVFEVTDPKSEEWSLAQGQIVAILTDCQNQAEYARLFATGPEVLEGLRNIVKMLDGSQPKDPVGALMAARYLVNLATGGKA